MRDQSRQRITVRSAQQADAVSIASIYNHYVANTAATFEEEIVSTPEMGQRIEDVWSSSLPWLVAEETGRIIGYAYATKWRTRSAYRFSVEVTAYLTSDYGGRGIGTLLYNELFPLLQTKGIHSIVGGIALPNDASVALHEKFGMCKVAHFQEVGFKFGRWIDVGYWQRTL